MRRKLSRSRLRFQLPWLLTSLIPLGAAGGIALAVLVQPASTASRTSSNPTVIGPPTGFGGYRYQIRQPVTEVAARWLVPGILPGSPNGFAGTWIGAENEEGDFVQIGTNEVKPSDVPMPIYAAFWSDTALGFHAQFLGFVHPGDLVSAEMVQQRDGWRLKLIDDGVSMNQSFKSGYGQRKRFTAVEWTQEDPLSRNGASTDLPYPKTSIVAFFGLKVNGDSPRLTFSDAVSLASPNGIYLVPSHPASDSFSLVSASRDQAQYLADIRPLDFAVAEFDLAITGLGSVAESQATTDLEGALTTFLARLRQQRWPPVATSRVPPLVRAVSNLIPAVRDYGTAPRNLDEARDFVMIHESALSAASRSMRTALGLPPH